MKTRCLNPHSKAYKHYGGRGIGICERWLISFANFLADVGRKPSPKHTLDRWPNPDGDYEPGNVRWATQQEQMNNQSGNRHLTLKDETHTVAEWARLLNVPRTIIKDRLRLGWSDEHALTTPVESNVMITHQGRTQDLTAWAREYGFGAHVLRYRYLKRGWSFERALTTPLIMPRCQNSPAPKPQAQG